MENDQKHLTGAYALNALDKEEREAFEAHAAESREVREEAESFEETAAMLALGVEPVAPPQRVKDNVMAAIRAKRQAEADNAPTHDAGARDAGTHGAGAQGVEQHAPTRPPSGVNPAAPANPATGGNVVDFGAERERRSANPRTVRWLSAAAGVLLVATGGLAGVVATQNSEQDRLQEQLAAVSGDNEELSRLFAASDLKSASQQMEGGAVVNLAYAPSAGMMAVSAHGLPELPADKAYELWLISPNGATPAGLLGIEATAAGEMRMVTGEMAGVTHFGITVEPSTGSPEPTTEPIMLQEL